MIIFINGSFGIGKTTVARLLAARLPSSAAFDPKPSWQGCMLGNGGAAPIDGC